MAVKNTPIVMPQMGQSVAEGTIIKWHKRIGDDVAMDEIVVEIESDKVNFQVESPASGKLLSCLKNEGQLATVGETIGLIGVPSTADDEPVEAVTPAAKSAGKPHAGANQEQILVSTTSGLDGFDYQSLPDITRDWYSPFVLRLALQNNITMDELKAIRGSGRQGRVTRDDLLRYLSQRPSKRPPAANEAEDVLPDNAGELGEVVPMTSVRRTIADHMVQSIHTSAHVTMVHPIDMTHIVALRNRIKAGFEKKYGVKMTYTTVMIFATARVLKEFPTLNASVYGTHMVRRSDINIGCAVALQDESLVVPVVRNVDMKTFPEVAQEMEQLIKKARERSLKRQDVEGGSFTISNFGGFGSLMGTPIINQPQVAILGMGAVFKAPVVMTDGSIVPRDQMYLSLSFDHRVIDGAMGGRFLNAIQRFTESLTEEMLDVARLA